MKNYSLFILMMLVFLPFSCNKEEYELTDETKEFLLTSSDYKKWELIDPDKVSPGILTSQYTIILPCSSEESPNGRGYFYNIYTDGTIELEDGCGAAGFLVGTWSFTNDKSQITVVFDSFTETWDIVELSVARFAFSSGGNLYTFAPIPI